MQIVWGKQISDSAVTFPVAFSETPIYVDGLNGYGLVNLTTTSFDHERATPDRDVNYLIIGKWK